MVPQPVVAVLLLFPVTKDSEAAKSKGINVFLHLLEWLNIIRQLPALCAIQLVAYSSDLPACQMCVSLMANVFTC